MAVTGRILTTGASGAGTTLTLPTQIRLARLRIREIQREIRPSASASFHRIDFASAVQLTYSSGKPRCQKPRAARRAVNLSTMILRGYSSR